jgi:hypothetical protein
MFFCPPETLAACSVANNPLQMNSSKTAAIPYRAMSPPPPPGDPAFPDIFSKNFLTADNNSVPLHVSAYPFSPVFKTTQHPTGAARSRLIAHQKQSFASLRENLWHSGQ